MHGNPVLCGSVLMAMLVALTFIAWFAQERWPFILTLSVYAGFCAYMMSGSKHAYFWQVSCFVVLVICFDAGPDPVNAFDTAMLRAQQTGLGVLTYSLIAIFLWPSRSINAFNAAATEQARTENQYYFGAQISAKAYGSTLKYSDSR